MVDRFSAINLRPAGARAAVAISLALTSLMPAIAAADGLAEILTGGGTREWVKESGGVFLGDPARSCTSGEAWAFNVDRTGLQILCEDGLWVQSPFGWHLRNESDGETTLNIADREYVLEVRERPSELAGEPPILIAILRTRRLDQGIPVEEIRLKFWER